MARVAAGGAETAAPMTGGPWQRFKRWREQKAVERFEDEPARQDAERRRFDAKTQARRPVGSGRRTGYDDGHTDQF